MPSSLKVQLTSDALEDVRQIGAYTRERWGEDKSDEYLDALERSLELLGEYPERGAVYGPIPTFRWVPVRDYNSITGFTEIDLKSFESFTGVATQRPTSRNGDRNSSHASIGFKGNEPHALVLGRRPID